MHEKNWLEVAYILKGFPRLSETFIANEIHLLETLGLPLRLYSIKPGEAMVNGVVSKIVAPLSYLPQCTSLSGSRLFVWLYHNLPKFMSAHVRLAKRTPRTYLKTLLLSISMCWRYRPSRLGKPRKVFIKDFLQAGFIALQVLERGSIRHLHGHFCHGATTVTWFVSLLTGLPFSFTAHAKDIYQGKLNPGDLLRRKLQAAQFVVTCTGANERHLSRLVPDQRIVHTIYHGLDTDYFSPMRKDAGGDYSPLILSVGRFVEKKGFAYLIEACNRLKTARVDFRCLIVGEKGDQYDRVRQLLEDLELQAHVSLQHAVTQEQLRVLYRQASVFALPCQVVSDGDRDGIPNVLVEAMAMGLPVISTPISGIPELIHEGENGLLIPERDSAALAAAIKRLFRDPQLRRRLGHAGRKTVCHRFDSRKTTRALHDLLASSLNDDRMAA